MVAFDPKKIDRELARRRREESPVWRAVFWTAKVCAIFFGLWLLSVLTPPDDTDAGRFNRSGATLVIDRGTGCHYLARLGGMAPRLDPDGRHICREGDRRQP